MPELNHNSVVGLGYPSELAQCLAVMQLTSEQHDHPRVSLRHQATAELLQQEAIQVDNVKAWGKSRLAQQVSLIQLGDYVSFYLAMAYEVNPTPVDHILQIKQRLASVD